MGPNGTWGECLIDFAVGFYIMSDIVTDKVATSRQTFLNYVRHVRRSDDFSYTLVSPPSFIKSGPGVLAQLSTQDLWWTTRRTNSTKSTCLPQLVGWGGGGGQICPHNWPLICQLASTGFQNGHHGYVRIHTALLCLTSHLRLNKFGCFLAVKSVLCHHVLHNNSGRQDVIRQSYVQAWHPSQNWINDFCIIDHFP